jgi:hypothetical protein
MVEVIYILCAVTSLACAILLVRAYRSTRSKLILWSSVCFVGLFLNNALLVIDEVVTGDQVNLLLTRDITNVASVTALLIGLIWNAPVSK